MEIRVSLVVFAVLMAAPLKTLPFILKLSYINRRLQRAYSFPIESPIQYNSLYIHYIPHRIVDPMERLSQKGLIIHKREQY